MKKYIILAILAGINSTIFACSSVNVNNRAIEQNIKQGQKFGYIKLDLSQLKLKPDLFNTKGISSPILSQFDFTNRASYKTRIDISGPGMTPIISPDYLTALAVPAGKNRVITLGFYDNDGGLIFSISGVSDIVASQTNIITLNYLDSLLAQIIMGVMEGSNPNVSANISLETLRTSITNLTGYDSSTKFYSKIDPVSINPLKIAEYMSANNGTFPPATTAGLTSFGSLTLNLNVTDASIFISDLSSNAVNTTSNKSVTINNITPGKWKLTVIKSGYKTSTIDVTINNTTTNTATATLVEKSIKSLDGGVGGD